MQFWGQIKILSRRHPLVTQGLIGATIQVVGDFIEQKTFEDKAKLDLERCRNSVLLGCLTGVVLGGWYRYLDNKVILSRKFAQVLCKVAADQLIFAKAIVTIASMDHEGFLPEVVLKAVKSEEKKFPDSMIISHKLWPSVQAVNFYCVPLKYQVAFNCMSATAWNFLECHCKHTKGQGNVELEAFEEWLLKSVHN